MDKDSIFYVWVNTLQMEIERNVLDKGGLDAQKPIIWVSD